MEEQLILIVKAKDQMSGILRKMKGEAESFGKVFKKKIGEASKQLFNLTKVVGIAAAGIATLGLKTAADLETARQGFITLLGSAEAADKTLARIKQEAKRTPFELTGLVKFTQDLSAITKNGDEAIDILLDVGEAVTASGKGEFELQRVVQNLQQVAATGTVTAMDIKQFASAVPGFFDILQESTGKSLDQLKEDNELTFETIREAFRQSTEEGGRFFGAFENQTGTLSQLVSNLKDNFVILGAELVTESGLFDNLKLIIKGLNNFLEENSKIITGAVTRAMSILSGLLVGIVFWLTQATDDVDELSAAFSQLLPESVLVALLEFRNFVQDIFKQLGIGKEEVLDIIKVMGILSSTFVTIAGAIRLITSPLSILGLTLAAIGTAVVILKKIWDENLFGIRDTLEKVGKTIGDVFEEVQKVFDEVQKVFDEVGRAIGAFINSPPIQNLIKLFRNIIIKVVENVQKAFEALQKVWDQKVRPAIENLINKIRPFIEVIGPIITDVVTAVVAIFGKLAEILSAVLAPAIEIVGGFITFLINLLAGIIEWLTAVIQTAELFVNAIFETFSWVVETIRQAFEGVKTIVETVWNEIRTKIEEVIGIIGGIIEGIVTVVTTIFEDVKKEVERIWEEIKKFIQGVIDSITGIIGGVIDTVGTLINDIKEALGLAKELKGKKIETPKDLGTAASLQAALEQGRMRGLADGGMVSANESILVGERGIEIFRPNVAGKIIPNNEVNNNQKSVNIENVNINNNMDFEMFKNTLLFNLG